MSGRLDRIESQVNNVVVNNIHNSTQNEEMIRSAVQNSRNLRELATKIFDSEGYFESNSIRPNTIETQFLSVGAKSSDFTTNRITMKAYKENNTFKVSLSAGYINHRALWWGGGGTPPTDINKFTWAINNTLIQVLPDNNKDYYIYVKADRNSHLATWFVSTVKIQTDEDRSYYHLLLGVIYPEQDNRRDISTVNGMAYLSGGSIYGDIIKSVNYAENGTNEGSMYDLNNGNIRIGNEKKGLLFDSLSKRFNLNGIDIGLKNELGELVSHLNGDTGAAMFGKGSQIFNADGSFSLAGGNILWDLTNGLNVTGKFESQKNGDRILINPTSRAITYMTSKNQIVGHWSFFDAGSIIQLFHRPSDFQVDETQITGNNISFNIKNTNSNFSLSARVGIQGAKFDIKNFPTKDLLASLEIGEFYRDGDVIKMKIS